MTAPFAQRHGFIRQELIREDAPMGEAVSKLYGFASEKGRHIKEGGEPAQKEAEFVVGIAATVATYLIRSEEQP